MRLRGDPGTTLSYRDIKITMTHVKGTNRKGGQLALLDGAFKQRRRNYEKSNVRARNNKKPWGGEESDF